MIRGVVLAAVLLACKTHDATTDPAVASGAPQPPRTKVDCAHLPGAMRSRLGKLPDGTLHYVELVEDAQHGKRELAFRLMRYDPASGRANVLVDTVSEYPVVTASGAIVFTRAAAANPKLVELVVTSVKGGEPKVVTPALGTVRGFVIDERAGKSTTAGHAISGARWVTTRFPPTASTASRSRVARRSASATARSRAAGWHHARP